MSSSANYVSEWARPPTPSLTSTTTSSRRRSPSSSPSWGRSPGPAQARAWGRSGRALRATNWSQPAPKWSRQCARDGCRARYCLAPRRRQASSATRRCSSRIASTQAPPHRDGSVDRSTLKTYATPSGAAGTTADVLPSHLKRRSSEDERSVRSITSQHRGTTWHVTGIRRVIKDVQGSGRVRQWWTRH